MYRTFLVVFGALSNLQLTPSPYCVLCTSALACCAFLSSSVWCSSPLTFRAHLFWCGALVPLPSCGVVPLPSCFGVLQLPCMVVLFSTLLWCSSLFSVAPRLSCRTFSRIPFPHVQLPSSFSVFFPLWCPCGASLLCCFLSVQVVRPSCLVESFPSCAAPSLLGCIWEDGKLTTWTMESFPRFTHRVFFPAARSQRRFSQPREACEEMAAQVFHFRER